MTQKDADAAAWTALSTALEAVETALDRLEPGGDADVVRLALAPAVRALDAAAKEALG